MAYTQIWFGTTDYSTWIDAPLAGAESTAEAWGSSGTLLNGGGYSFNSLGSNKVFIYEWRDSSARRMAQTMKSFRDGTFGRGLLYWHSPNNYDTNLLPAQWADPSMSLGDELPSLVTGAVPDWTPTSNFQQNLLPVRTAVYNLNGIATGHRNGDSVFIPIPEGYNLHLGAFYSSTGSGGVFYAPVSAGDILGTPVQLFPLSNTSTNVVNTVVSSAFIGVRLYVGKSTTANSSVSVAAMTARLIPSTRAVTPSFLAGPWIGGAGHSGARFEGTPTWVENSGVDGGQIGYAATFREVGSWA